MHQCSNISSFFLVQFRSRFWKHRQYCYSLMFLMLAAIAVNANSESPSLPTESPSLPTESPYPPADSPSLFIPLGSYLGVCRT